MSDYLQYGGQAVIEGVMMRSPRYYAIACRKPDGSVIVHEEPVANTIIGRLKWLNRPVLRGTLALVDAMALGMRALSFSATVQSEALEDVGASKQAADAPPERAPQPPDEAEQTGDRAPRSLNDIYIGATLVFAFMFGLAVFVALPTFITQVLKPHLGVTMGSAVPYRQQVLLNFVDGVVRIAIFLAYIGAIGQMSNIRRVFQYHGAEHKAINTLEAGQPVVLENCERQTRIHPRCGTSFIIVVLLASILVHSVFPRPDFYLTRVALHVSLIPLVAGVAYEVIKLAGRFRGALATRVLLAPGLWSQRLTTREPDASQVEVAMAALNAVIARENEATPSAAPAAAAS